MEFIDSEHVDSIYKCFSNGEEYSEEDHIPDGEGKFAAKNCHAVFLQKFPISTAGHGVYRRETGNSALIRRGLRIKLDILYSFVV